MPTDKRSGKLKGYAKAVMSTVQEAKRIASYNSLMIDGLDVGVSLWKSQSDYLSEKDDQVQRKVFARLPLNASEDKVKLYFSKFGPIERVSFKYDIITNEPRGFCYI